MRKIAATFLAVGTVLVLSGAAGASSLPPRVAADYYNPSHVNGIPTPNETGNVDVHDAINHLRGLSSGDAGYLSANYQADSMLVSNDSIWTNHDGGVALVSLSAGFNNSIGYYTDLGTGAVRTELMSAGSGYGFRGDGTAADPYQAAGLGVSDGAQFGWYLDADGQGTTNYYSEGDLNSGSWDHMMTYALGSMSFYVDVGAGPMLVQLDNAYVLAWEDLPWNGSSLGDDDFNDNIYVTGMVSPGGGSEVPEPATLLLLGAGGMALGIVKRRRRR